MKKLLFILAILSFTLQLKAQTATCIFKPPLITINFGAGRVPDLNTEDPSNYSRVARYCPTDGHYAYTSYTSDCFRGDWVSLQEDHTPGDVDGNMMLVNASPYSGAFLKTTIIGLKQGTTYEFSVWMMNVCRPTDKCPFPLLPNITILLQTPDGKTVAQFGTGELERRETPEWTPYRALFTTLPAETPLTLTMIDNAPGGCGNDFALDDISFRECVKTKPVVTPVRKIPAVTNVPKAPVITKVAKTPVPKTPPVTTAPKPPVVTPVPKAPVVVKQQPAPPKPVTKKEIPAPVKRPLQSSQIAKPQTDTRTDTIAALKPKPPVFAAPPPVLATRANPLIRQIEFEAGEITFNLYDNGQVDGDTVSIYHNNVLLVAHARLSEKPITFNIAIDAAHPHHELIMVADNLGSIPPNTSLMVITAGAKRYEVFISSTEQKNAKVILDLKQ